MSIGRVQLVAAIPYYRIEGPSTVIPGNVLGLPLLDSRSRWRETA